MNEEKNENNINNEVKNGQITEVVKDNANTKMIEEIKNATEKTQQTTQKSKNNLLKIISKITTAIIWIFLFIAMGILLLTVASQKTDIFGYRIYTIMSGSMEPTIHVKDAILTQKIEEPKQVM